MSNRKEIKFDTDFCEAMIIVLIIMCWGKPDIIDGLIHHFTGVKVWECPSNDCVTKPEPTDGAR